MQIISIPNNDLFTFFKDDKLRDIHKSKRETLKKEKLIFHFFDFFMFFDVVIFVSCTHLYKKGSAVRNRDIICSKIE